MVMKYAAAMALAIGLFASAGWGRTVGLWQDGRSGITDGMLKTLAEAGWQTEILKGKGLSDEAKLGRLDVLFLPGGHNAYFFADFKARRAMVKFLAGGKGILAGAVRSGYVRTANRPIFPQVGEVYNRVNGPYISAYGDSELAKAIDKPFCPGNWDHMVVKVGPLGKVFAVNGDDPVGVYGEPYGGRCLIFGAFIGSDAKSNAMEGTERRVLLKFMDWLGAVPKLSEADKAKHQKQADLDFLRREKIWDWTLNERGPDKGPGVLPQIRNQIALQLERRQFTLEYMSRFLSGKQLDACRAASAGLRGAIETLDVNFRKQAEETAARINAMAIDELLAENPFVSQSNVIMRIEAVPGKTEEERKAIKAKLGDTFAARSVALFLHGDATAEKMMPVARKNNLIALSDRLLDELRPAVNAAKAAKLADERQQDAASIPGLIEKCASPDSAVRRAALLELGRIGEPKAAPVMIRALKDGDEKARVNAVLGLGWMQAREAVPALLEALGGKDLMLRRRAAQALGQIGDMRAVKPLVGVLGDKDCDVAVNACLSLGWLKAKDAVPELLKIVTTLDRKNADQRALMLAGIRALGHIGDASALPALTNMAAEAKDWPVLKRIGRVKNVYSTSKSLGLQGHARLAIEEIKAGGRGEVGVRQAGFLASKDIFYRMTGKFNALAGRPETSAIWPYLKDAGMTGVHNAWGSPGADPAAHLQAISAAGELDLCWIDCLPTDYGSANAAASRTHGVEKPAGDLVLLKLQDEPAFQGFWFEETYPSPSFTKDQFYAWLKARHGADYRNKLGLKAGETTFDNSHVLMVEFLHFNAELQLASWRESQDWLKGLRKGCSFTYTISDAEPTTWPGLTAAAGAAIDSIGPETYQCFGRFNSFFLEMHKDGEARPVLAEFYNWYTPSPAHEIRGFAQHLMHGECFYSFHIEHIFEHASPYNMWSWAETRWGNAKKIFHKARKIGSYIGVPASAANVGLVLSDLSNLAVDPWNYSGGLGKRWPQNRCALWTALNQSQIPADIIWAESMTAEKLRRYRALVLADARIVTAGQAQLLRDWVAEGGALIAAGATSRFDPWSRELPDYGMADVFGVTFAGFAGVSDPDQIDTYCWKLGGPTAAKIVSGLGTDAANLHVHRDIKPVKSIGLYKTADKASPLLPGIAPGMACEYDMPLGYDKVKATSAETLATFANGDPALTVNPVGKGVCYLWTPVFPGLCHTVSGWEMHANKFDFWPGTRELLAAMVKGGLARQDASLPAEVIGVSREVEVTLRRQPEHNRMMVHLLDYDTKSDGVKGAEMIAHAPEGKTVKRVFYPDTDTDVKFAAAGGRAAAKLRDFEVHDMVVVEWE